MLNAYGLDRGEWHLFFCFFEFLVIFSWQQLHHATQVDTTMSRNRRPRKTSTPKEQQINKWLTFSGQSDVNRNGWYICGSILAQIYMDTSRTILSHAISSRPVLFCHVRCCPSLLTAAGMSQRWSSRQRRGGQEEYLQGLANHVKSRLIPRYVFILGTRLNTIQKWKYLWIFLYISISNPPALLILNAYLSTHQSIYTHIYICI